jgi:hypothetical protein
VEPGELDPQTLVERFVQEVTAAASFVVAASELTAWTLTD